MTAHAPGPEGIFGTRALCGADVTVSPVLTLTQVSDDVDCLVCADMLRRDAPIVMTRPSRIVAAIVLAILAAFTFTLLVATTKARAAAVDDCVTLPEARTVLAGDNVGETLRRIAPDHGQIRYHAPRVRDVTGCHWRHDFFRYSFRPTSAGKVVAGWRFIHCAAGSDCSVVAHSGSAR